MATPSAWGLAKHFSVATVPGMTLGEGRLQNYRLLCITLTVQIFHS
jgi:hypothetical protein